MQATSVFRVTGILSILCLAVSVQAAPTFEWVPVRANGGAFTIDGNEITLTDHTGPVEVELDLRLSGWGSAVGNPLLMTYSAEVDVNSFASGLGAPLTGLGAFIITNTCTLSGNPCSPPFDSTCDNSAEGFCVIDPDYPFDIVFDLCANNVGLFYCAFSLAGLPDLGNSVHGGYLILDIPTDALGTYTINLDGDPNATFMVELGGTVIPGLVLKPALITIPLPVGRCCSSIGPTPICEDNLTEQECDLRPAPRVWVEGATCAGECPCPACLSNLDCNDSNACTADVCFGCGQCMSSPNYDEATECCNPASGNVVWIDDDDACTSDTCDPSTGQLSHTGIPDCISFDADAFPKNRYVSFETGVLPVVLGYHVRMTASVHFPDSVGDLGWVGVPDSHGTALVVPDPVFLPSWPFATIRVGDCEIVPAATYEIRSSGDGVNFDSVVVVETTAPPTAKFWGDIVGDFNGMAWTPPNGVLNFADVQAALLTFQNGESNAPLIWADIGPETPNRVVNFNEVLWLLLAFVGEPYPFSAPADCP